MSIAIAQPRHIFGLRSDVTSNVAYFDEQTIVYPSGTSCILYNMDQKQQRFIQGSEKSKGMTAMAISPNRRYIAVAERGDKEKGDKAVVTIYDLHSLRKRKILSSTDIQSDEFVSLAFSPDSKYLATQSGKPDWMLLYWTWEKSKVMATIKTTNPQTNVPISQVTFNPLDNTQLCVVGSGIFKLFRYSEGSLKQFAFQKMEPINYLCQAWVSDERLVIGAENGKLLLYESGELKREFDLVSLVNQTSGSDADKVKDKQRPSLTNGEADSGSSNLAVTAIAAYSKGFAVACGPGTVHIFEKTDDKEYYKRTREIKIPQDMNSSEPTKMQHQQITCLTISPSEEVLVCSTSSNQLYMLTLSSTDINKVEKGQFEVLSQTFHSDQVTGVDVCMRKPLIATCSTDKSVRIWNYENCQLDLYKEFAEEAYSIALHPTGLYILVGFSDKLRLMNLLIDDIRTFKEFTIRACKECCFSNGGQYFAAVNTNVISIYSTITFENIANLKGHNGKVRSVVWSLDDSKLVSCGADGAVYEWELLTSKRVGENVLKLCNYTSVVVTADGKTTFAVGSDKKLKEIADSQILRTVDSADTVLTSLALSHSGRMLFAGTALGTLRSLKFPLTVPGEWVEYQAHGAQISKIKITYDDQYLITIAEDAGVMIWKIQDKEGRGIKRDKEISYAEEILITKSDLEEKNVLANDLKTRVDELKMENDYQLRLKDMTYNEKIKELTEKFIQEMEALKTKNQVLKNDKDKEENKHEEQVNEIMEKHAKELQDLESTNNQKLMLEYEKFQELQGKSQRMQEDYERQLSEMEEKKEQALQSLTEYFEAKIQELTRKLDQEKDNGRQSQAENEEMKKQIEEDSDREILNMRNKFEQKLHEEQEMNQKLKGESGIMRKKFTSLQKEIEDYKEEIKKNQGEISKLNNIIRNLEKDIQGLKKEIQERDETIQDKERRILELKKKNQELEKFKFVLDYKIKELKKQIEPRENDIKAMKEQIQEMESELERFHKLNTQLELNVEELRQKLKATEKEMHSERQKVDMEEAMVRRFKTDLHNCVGYIQDPKLLKDSIKAMYQKHVQEDVTETASVDADKQKDFARQREHLERSVASLSKKQKKDSEIHRADNVRIMQENVSLIKEINDLRRELKMSRTRIHDLEAALGLNSKSRTVGVNRSSLIIENEIEEKNKILELQHNEILKLRNTIYSLENTVTSRPPSGQRLSPITIGAV